MHQPNDPVTRTNRHGQQETVRLPPINMAHLQQAQVDGGKINGLHILPSGVSIPSTAPLTLPAGTVAVVDQHGSPIADAQVRITPGKLPRSGHDTLDAKVKVLDSAGAVLASHAQKTFFPQAWSHDQIQQAIYAAFIQGYQANHGVPGGMVGRTPQNVMIELKVQGMSGTSGPRLTGIRSAFPQPGQRLDSSHQP
jgi:hypothetical protein